MPSAKRRTTRTAQLQPQQAQSDYDTDTANITDIAAQQAPPPQRTDTDLNLTVLRRYVPDIERTVEVAPFSVVYTFSQETQQWEKSGVEGTLFVCQLTGARYSLVILNRKSLDNFILELVSADDIDITEDYVIVQVMGEDGTLLAYGLWIFSENDGSQPNKRDRVAQSIQRCAMQAQMSREDSMPAEEMNGHSHAEEYDDYGADGSTQMQQQMGEEEAVSHQAGQRLDLLQLFTKPPMRSNAQFPAQPDMTNPPPVQANIQLPLHPNPVSPQPVIQAHAQPSRFASTADTDFFRGSHSPAAPQQQQPQPPPSQQNALLDLFKSAR